MITDEERREVARRLREIELAKLPDSDREMQAIHEAVGCLFNQPHYFNDVTDRLADLIEPEPERTCINLSDNGGFTCSECGANVYGASYGSSYVDGDGKRWYTTANQPQWNYCPNCGARVIEEASDDADR